MTTQQRLAGMVNTKIEVEIFGRRVECIVLDAREFHLEVQRCDECSN